MPFVAVLIEPKRAANVGAAARAVKNFGAQLRLVGGDHALPGGASHAEASAVAWNAQDVLDSAARFASLDAAIADATLSAAASARVEPGRDAVTLRAFAAEAARLPADAVVACVFGSEESGLTNVQLDACRVRVRIPTADPQPSLNLAQSVVVVAYEMAQARLDPGAAPAGGPELAREGEIGRLMDSLKDLALRAGYLNAASPEHVLGELRRLLARARPSEREVTLLLGLVAQLRWAQEHLSRDAPPR